MKIRLKQALSGLNFSLKATDIVDTTAKDSLITAKDAARMVDRGIAEQISEPKKKTK
jgi:hypothetical protein